MASTTQDRSLGLFLTDTEVEEFRILTRQHAGAELSADEAQSVAGQLLRVLAIIRDSTAELSNDSVVPVDDRPLPNPPDQGINTFPIH